MNNKRLGTAFERMVCEWLAKKGCWVHFITPDASGAQPFDIIAVHHGRAIALDCKTCADHIFRISRLEDNQIMAFEKWLKCGNEEPLVFIEYKRDIYIVGYRKLKELEKVDLQKREEFDRVEAGEHGFNVWMWR